MGAIPVLLDTTNRRFVFDYGRAIRIPGFPKLNIYVGQILPVVYALTQGVFIARLLWILAFVPVSDLDKFLGIFMNIVLILCYAVQILILFHAEDLKTFANCLLGFDDQMCKRHLITKGHSLYKQEFIIFISEKQMYLGIPQYTPFAFKPL